MWRGSGLCLSDGSMVMFLSCCVVHSVEVVRCEPPFSGGVILCADAVCDPS